MRKILLLATIKTFVVLLIANPALGVEIKIMGPSGNVLAPDTEYGFGVWIRNPDAWGDDFTPDRGVG